MSKDEFDFDDPLELNGVALYTDEDTSRDMAECFVEEFLRMGYNHKQLLALFRNPHYLGMNMVLQNKGEPFVRDIIAEVFARWGKRVEWPMQSTAGVAPDSEFKSAPTPDSGHEDGDRRDACPALTDPMGNPIPKLE